MFSVVLCSSVMSLDLFDHQPSSSSSSHSSWEMVSDCEEAETANFDLCLVAIASVRRLRHRSEKSRRIWGWLCMASCLSTVNYSLVFFFLTAVEENSDPLGLRALVAWDVEEMPVAWEKRYYRATAATGMELCLLNRSNERASTSYYWVVVKPDLTLAKLDIGHRASASTTPVQNIFYSPMAVLSPAQKTTLMAQAVAAVAQNAPISTMSRYGQQQVAVVTFLGRIAAGCMLVPSRAGSLVRWASRSRWRVGSVLMTLTMSYDILRRMGIFQWMHVRIECINVAYADIKEAIIEMSETAQWAREQFSWSWSLVEVVMEPWRALLYFCALSFFGWRMMQEEQETPQSSAAPTPASESPGATDSPTPMSLEVSETQALLMAVTKRLESMEVRATFRDQIMESKVEQMELQKRAEDLLKEEKTQEERQWRTSDREAVREVLQKLGKFESVIYQEEGERKVLRAKIEELKEKVESAPRRKAEYHLDLSEDPPLPPPPLRPPPAEEPVKEVIAMLKRKTELPSQTFLRLVENYREVQHWEDHFPAGFRTRVGCHFLGEVLGTGKRCEAWAREFLGSKRAYESKATKELVPTMMALDSMIFVDANPDLVNTVAFERLSRKALAIVETWKNVEKKEDWSKPASAPKTWKSKVDYSVGKKIDPMLKDRPIIEIRELEEEIRKETEREASLLKAKAKLDQYSGHAE